MWLIVEKPGVRPLFNSAYIQPTLSKEGQLLFEVPASSLGKPMRLVFNKHNPEFHWGDAEGDVLTLNMPALTNVEGN